MIDKLVYILAIFLLSSTAIFLVLNGFIKKRAMEKRIHAFLPATIEDETEQQKVEKERKIQLLFLSLAGFFRHIRFSKKTERVLLEAGSSLKPEEFFMARILMSGLTGALGFLFGFPWFVWMIAAVVGFIFPIFYMKKKREKRLKMISYQLVEILGMMANSMRAGFSFMQAMQLVGKEMPDPLGPEFERVVRQAGLGISLDDVFKEMMVRLPNKELEVVIQAILAQRKSGGNLAVLLETMEETIRGRIRILEELNTLTAQGRMSSWVITLLPVGLGLYLGLANREYFGPMLDHPLGWTMLTMCAFSIITGWFVIQKIIKIEV
jgi:tight adherence protein B